MSEQKNANDVSTRMRVGQLSLMGIPEVGSLELVKSFPSSISFPAIRRLLYTVFIDPDDPDTFIDELKNDGIKVSSLLWYEPKKEKDQIPDFIKTLIRVTFPKVVIERDFLEMYFIPDLEEAVKAFPSYNLLNVLLIELKHVATNPIFEKYQGFCFTVSNTDRWKVVDEDGKKRFFDGSKDMEGYDLFLLYRDDHILEEYIQARYMEKLSAENSDNEEDV